MLQEHLNMFNMMITPTIFLFFQNSNFSGFNAAKGQKMTQNYQFQSVTHSISQERWIISKFLVHRCKIMIFPGVFLYIARKAVPVPPPPHLFNIKFKY